MWKTQAGKFTTSKKENVDFCLPGFSATIIVTWKCHIDESTNGRYEMILGRDLLTALGLDIKFSDNVLSGREGPHEGCSAPMVDVSNYDLNIITAKIVRPEESFINSYVNECLKSESAIIATRRMCRILDAKYKNAELDKVMTEQFQHLNTKECKRLLNILTSFEDLFDGTLGTYNTTIVDLKLRYNANPVYLRPYPVPRAHKAIFKK